MARGPHADDLELFGDASLPALRAAVFELSWLLERGYAESSALQLVGDRHRLRQRQRLAVRRCACGDAVRNARRARRVPVSELAGRPVAVDGFNCIITVESAMAGGVLLRGRDEAVRDLASVHGSYRRVATTEAALASLADALARVGASDVRWYLDRPVSNSGRLRDMILEARPDKVVRWEVELPFDPDRCLVQSDAVVATSDANVLDGVRAWVDLVGSAIAADVPDAWLLDLSDV